MLKRTLILAALALALAAPAGAAPSGPVPATLKKVRPYQVVEEVMARTELLALTPTQFAALDDLARSIRNEKHTWVRVPGKQAPGRHVPMTNHQKAFDQALAILTPEQQARFTGLYAAPIESARPAPRRDRGILPGKP